MESREENLKNELNKKEKHVADLKKLSEGKDERYYRLCFVTGIAAMCTLFYVCSQYIFLSNVFRVWAMLYSMLLSCILA